MWTVIRGTGRQEALTVSGEQRQVSVSGHHRRGLSCWSLMEAVVGQNRPVWLWALCTDRGRGGGEKERRIFSCFTSRESESVFCNFVWLNKCVFQVELAWRELVFCGVGSFHVPRSFADSNIHHLVKCCVSVPWSIYSSTATHHFRFY